MCDTLHSRAKAASATPASLAERLQGIAGESCDQPLYMAGGERCELPSMRRQRNRRIKQSGMAVVAMACTLFILSVLLAPEPVRVSDPVALARSEYGLGVTVLNVNRTFGAVLLAHSRGAALSEPVSHGPRATMLTASRSLTHEEAVGMLRRSSGDDLTYSGVQRVWITNGEGQFHVSDVSIDQVPSMGVSLSVLDANGKKFSSWFVPPSSTQMEQAPASWQFQTYDGLDQVAGRWARLLEARDADGVPVSRWWLDSGTGQLLWSERYDTSGSPVVIAGFTEFNLDRASLNATSAELLFMHQASTTSLNTDRSWCQGLDHCPDSLAGLPLVGHASSRAYGITTMRLIYSDGFRNISVQWIEGSWDGEGVTHNSVTGFPDVAAWQAGDGVVSVATNGGLELLDEAAEELPEPSPYESSVFKRAHSGLMRILGIA